MHKLWLVCAELLGAWSHATCTESQSMLMHMNHAQTLAGDVPVLAGDTTFLPSDGGDAPVLAFDAPVPAGDTTVLPSDALDPVLGTIAVSSTDRAAITQSVGEKAAEVWGEGFDIIHEDFLHSHLRVHFEVEKAMMSPVTRAALNNTQAVCRGANGKKVLVAGMPRAASTTMFELIQILLYFCDKDFKPFQQTLHSTYFVDDPDFHWEPFSKVGESALVKTHTASEDTANWGDVIFTSHRDPTSLLHSQWLTFHGTETSCPDNKPVPCEGWSNCQREMERQACFYAVFPADKLKYDMSTE